MLVWMYNECNFQTSRFKIFKKFNLKSVNINVFFLNEIIVL